MPATWSSVIDRACGQLPWASTPSQGRPGLVQVVRVDHAVAGQVEVGLGLEVDRVLARRVDHLAAPASSSPNRAPCSSSRM